MHKHAQYTGRGLYIPLAREQDTTGPDQSPAQDVFFLTFGKTGRAPDNYICPLGKVLTYKNLIYLLNFPVSMPML